MPLLLVHVYPCGQNLHLAGGSECARSYGTLSDGLGLARGVADVEAEVVSEGVELAEAEEANVEDMGVGVKAEEGRVGGGKGSAGFGE